MIPGWKRDFAQALKESRAEGVLDNGARDHSGGDSNGSSHWLTAATGDSAQLSRDPRQLGIVRPEKRPVEGRASAAAIAARRRSLSQFSHGLTRRYRTMASMPDTQQDADLRIRTPAYWPDSWH
jgi:hypothetical protein